MTTQTTTHLKLATAGLLALTVLTGVLASGTASAAIVTGNVNLSIDNTAFNGITGWSVDTYFNSSFNTTAIGASNPGTSTSTSNMLFPVNTNAGTVFYGNPPNRYLEATTMDAANTSVGQIGLSGALRLSVPGAPGAGILTPYDFTLQNIGGTWNLVSHDLFFGGTTFLQLINTAQSVDGNGALSLSGDLIFGNGTNKYPSNSGLTWGGFLGVAGPGQSVVVGSLSLAPAAVPVPAAVWLFGSGLLGVLGVSRKKAALKA